MARLRPGQKRRVPLHKTYAKGLKSLGKKALKATPPGMMLTAAQKLKEELGRLTKPKRDPSVYKTGPGRKPKKEPKIRDLLYRPKRDKDGKIIKPKPRDLLYRPKYDSKGNIIKPKAIPMKVRKPKKK